jgi:NADPH:quinone reductase-like Zn-dependent oxidoreductase
LIKVDCAVINPSDVSFMTGKFNVVAGSTIVFPFTPGWEGAGTIEAVGEKLAGMNLIGKRVGFLKQGDPTRSLGGAMAEYCVTSMR